MSITFLYIILLSYIYPAYMENHLMMNVMNNKNKPLNADREISGASDTCRHVNHQKYPRRHVEHDE